MRFNITKPITESFPDHKGRPGQVGGSLPKGSGGGSVSKEKSIDKKTSISKLEVPSEDIKFDSRYAPSVYDTWLKDRKTVSDWKSGKIKAVADVTSDEYRCVITNNDRMLYFKTDTPNTPVPSGNWMRWWESDLGVSEKNWQKLNTKDRATLECKLQLKKWVSREFYSLTASFYLPKQYGDWWFSSGSKLHNLEKQNEYWKNKFNK